MYPTSALPLHVEPAKTSFNLSTTTKLEHLVFRCTRSNVQWVTRALQTVQYKSLQRITVRVDTYTFLGGVTKPIRHHWHDLDRMLVQFWTLHSIRSEVMYEARTGNKDMRDYAPTLLPEPTTRGVVDLAEYNRPLVV